MKEKRCGSRVLACVVCSICLLMLDFRREGSFFACCGKKGNPRLFWRGEGRRKPILWVAMGREGTYCRRATGGMCDPPLRPPQPPGLPFCLCVPILVQSGHSSFLQHFGAVLYERGEGGSLVLPSLLFLCDDVLRNFEHTLQNVALVMDLNNELFAVSIYPFQTTNEY